MSFILDALKKSENDRQRQIGPALFEVRVARPRSQYPMWAIVLLALLAVNLAVIGWLMFRRPATAATPHPAQASAAAPAAPPPGAQQPAAAAPPVAQSAPPAQMAAPVTYAPAPVAEQPAAPAWPPPAAQPYQQGAVSYQQPAAAPYQQTSPPPYQQARFPAPAPAPGSPEYAGTPPLQQGPPQQERPGNAEQANPDDYAPATEPNEADLPFGHVRRGLANGLMTYEQAAAKNSIPPLHMDLHVYAPDPRKRFVLVNSRRLFEGESLPEGVRVDSITTDGVILSYRGVQFMLERQ